MWGVQHASFCSEVSHQVWDLKFDEVLVVKSSHLDLFLNFRGWFKEQDDPGKRCSHGGIRSERQEIYGVPVPKTAAFSEELLLGRLESWRVLWDGEGKSVEKPKRLTGFYGEKCRPLCNSRADGTCNGAEICRLLA